MASVSYGYGLAVSPLHVVAGIATLVNGGRAVRPTLMADGDAAPGAQVIKPETSAAMRRLMRAVIASGSGKRADVAGFEVGGKTGSAQKVVGGRYRAGTNRTAFVGAFPISAPQYALFVMLDEPQKLAGDWNNNAGMNAVPTAGAIIAAAAPILGVRPRGVSSPLLAAAMAEAARIAKTAGSTPLEETLRTTASDDAPPPLE